MVAGADVPSVPCRRGAGVPTAAGCSSRCWASPSSTPCPSPSTGVSPRGPRGAALLSALAGVGHKTILVRLQPAGRTARTRGEGWGFFPQVPGGSQNAARCQFFPLFPIFPSFRGDAGTSGGLQNSFHRGRPVGDHLRDALRGGEVGLPLPVMLGVGGGGGLCPFFQQPPVWGALAGGSPCSCGFQDRGRGALHGVGPHRRAAGGDHQR